MDILRLLNENAGALSLLFAAIVAVATVFYARLTKALVDETRRMRAAQTDPQLIVQVEGSQAWIALVDIVIRNVGGGAAHNIKLTLDRDLAPKDGEPLSGWGPFKHGIAYLAPGQKVSRFLGNIMGELDEIERPGGRYAVTVTATYSSAFGESRSESFPLDFRQFIGLTTIGSPPERDMADALRKLQDDIHNLATGWRKIQVDVYSERDRQAARDERKALLAQRRLERAKSSPDHNAGAT